MMSSYYIDVQPASHEPAPKSHDLTAISQEQPQPPSNTNEQQVTVTSNDRNTDYS